jgi:hypothetical protein
MTRSRLLLALSAGVLGCALAACGGSAGTTSGTLAPVTNVDNSARPGAETGTDQSTGIGYKASFIALPNSGIQTERVSVARDANAWKQLWTEYAGTPSDQPLALDIDFSRDMVIGIFPGAHSPCEKFSISAVKQKAGPARIEVEYSVIPPPPNIACIASISFPALFVVVPQSDLSVKAVHPAPRPAGDLVIRSGTRVGFIRCVEDCERTIEIAQDGAAFHSYGVAAPQPPERGIWSPVSAAEWLSLVATVGTVPDVLVGCPGCADEAVEWVEIEQGGTKKRLTFNCGADLPGASQFLQNVRAIRGRLGASLGLPDMCSPGAIAFTRIPPAVLTSAIADKRFVTVRDAASWSALWQEHVGSRTNPDDTAPALPAMDFSRQMVLAVFLGKESVSCGSMSIESVHQRSSPDRIEVGYRVVDPGPDVMCIAANLNQYSFVVVPASPLPVEYVKLP